MRGQLINGLIKDPKKKKKKTVPPHLKGHFSILMNAHVYFSFEID